MDARLPLVASPQALPPRRSLRRPTLLAAGLALAVAMVAFAAWRVLLFGALVPAPVPAVETVVMPAVATAGAVAFTIPAGAAVAQLAGGEPYLMPDTKRLAVGDEFVVRNDDVYPRMIFSLLVQPGETGTMTVAEPGVAASSSGGSANGGTMNRFTSVIVSERRA